jgi:hypothetical protein
MFCRVDTPRSGFAAATDLLAITTLPRHGRSRPARVENPMRRAGTPHSWFPKALKLGNLPRLRGPLAHPRQSASAGSCACRAHAGGIETGPPSAEPDIAPVTERVEWQETAGCEHRERGGLEALDRTGGACGPAAARPKAAALPSLALSVFAKRLFRRASQLVKHNERHSRAAC